eukprot:scaffold3839_cov67-Phaeocystis_antarctica.AAC.1
MRDIIKGQNTDGTQLSVVRGLTRTGRLDAAYIVNRTTGLAHEPNILRDTWRNSGPPPPAVCACGGSGAGGGGSCCQLPLPGGSPAGGAGGATGRGVEIAGGCSHPTGGLPGGGAGGTGTGSSGR